MASEGPLLFWRIMLWAAPIIGGIIALIANYKINRIELSDKKEKERTEAIKAEEKEKKLHSIIYDSIGSNRNIPDEVNETKSDKKSSKTKMENKDRPNETYNVTSNNQTGGLTVGKIDKLIISDEGEINPMENFIVDSDDNLTFKVRPKAGKWIQPFFMIPRAEKDSSQFTVDTASGQSFDLYMGVEEENAGIKLYGAVFGLGSAVPNPATKDFYYSITFTKVPSYFIFGDHASGRAFKFVPH